MRMLEGKVALVTGATSAIGRASALLFAGEGAIVALMGLRSVEGEAAAAEIEAKGGRETFIQADLTDIAGIANIVARVVDGGQSAN